MNNVKQVLNRALKELYAINRMYASLPIMLGLLGGIIPQIYLSDLDQLWRVVSTFLFVVLFAPTLKQGESLHSKVFVKVLLFSAIGWCAAQYNMQLSTDHYNFASSSKNHGAVIEARVIDTSCAGEDSEWLGNPRFVYADVLKMKYSAYDEWFACSGKIMLKLREAPLLKYGDVVCAEGAIVTPEVGTYSGNGYSNYLRARDVYKIFEAQSLKITSHCSGFIDVACRFRNSIMKHAVDGMQDNTAKIVAALFFGCKQGVSYKTKQTFFLSGTSHAFAISGLHIGILSILTLTVLKIFPVRLRFLTLPIILFLYVITVGMRVSAIRALIMISVWAFHRALLYRTSPVNIIFYTASVVLVVSPFSLADIGFQYSFVTVFFLIVSWKFVNRWSSVFVEPRAWDPATDKSVINHWSVWWRRWVFQSLAFCTLAWIASSALAALYSGFYILTAVFVNLCLIPLLMVLFFAVFFKLLIPVPFAHYGSVCIDLIVDVLLQICNAGASYGVVEYVGGVSIIVVFIYFLAVFSGVIAQSTIRLTISAVVVVLLILFVCAPQFSSSTETIVLRGGRQPVVVVIDNEMRSASVINCGSYEQGIEVRSLLRSKGIVKVDKVVVAGYSSEYFRGVGYLCDNLDVGIVYAKTRYMRVRRAQYLRDKCHLNGVRFVELDDLSVVSNSSRNRVVVNRDKNGYTVLCRGIRIAVEKSEHGITTLDVEVGCRSLLWSYEAALVGGATTI